MNDDTEKVRSMGIRCDYESDWCSGYAQEYWIEEAQQWEDFDLNGESVCGNCYAYSRLPSEMRG